MGKLSFRPKSTVMVHGKPWRVVRTVSPTEVLLEEAGTHRKEVFDIADLKADSDQAEAPPPAIDSLDENDLAEAKRRLEVIKPLLSIGRGRTKAIDAVATEYGLGRRTIERWLHNYEARELLSDLAPQRRKRPMPTRLHPEVEALVAKVIEDFYLTKQNLSPRKAYETLKRLCAGIRRKVPHEETFRRRLDAVPEELKLRRRRGRKAARDRFAEVKGAFPGADFPLAVVQIDHTKLDIELVDDELRLPIGRPWLTLAIDVYSRMVTGFYLSLDPPSVFSVGMCIAHSALDKDAHLDRLGIKGRWPVWGLPCRIHADNGKEFRSKTLDKACQQYGIAITWRLVKVPHYGGHIERFLGTTARELHAIPGTTFANTRDRGEYDSAKQAVITLDALERWLTQFFVGIYHQRVHSGIGCPPEEQWRRGIMGHGRHKGTGLPDPIPDPRRFWRDLLPYTERLVRREGIVWDKISYFSDALRPWINARNGGRAQKFIVRRNPRDISRLYFLDPELGDYLEIPYRDLAKPSISIWEYREAERFLRDQGRAAENEDVIFAAREEMTRIVAEAKTETRKARRSRQRRKPNAQATEPGTAPIAAAPSGRLSLVVDNTGRQADEFDIPDDIAITFEEL